MRDLTDWPYRQWNKPVEVRFNPRPGEKIGRYAMALVLEDHFNEELDLAILSVEVLPEGVTPLPLAGARNTTGHATRMFGFPEGHEQGLHGEGKVLGPVRDRKRQELQLRSTEVTHGYSGGPVWDDEWSRVIGMVLHGQARPPSSQAPSGPGSRTCSGSTVHGPSGAAAVARPMTAGRLLLTR